MLYLKQVKKGSYLMFRLPDGSDGTQDSRIVAP